MEINVTDPETYEIYVSGLEDGVFVSAYNYSKDYLSSGIQFLNVSLNGGIIYASKANISRVSYVGLSLFDKYIPYPIDSQQYLPLNRTYEHNEFESLAFFTGRILDEGIDEDGDPLFDYLQISVEINVTDPGYYRVEVISLLNNGTIFLDIPSVAREFEIGVHLVNFTVYGPRIYAARIDPSQIESVRLYRYLDLDMILLEDVYRAPLPIPYHYYEFESHALLTGRVYDEGVDTDFDQLFDYLEVGIEVNITEAGTYQVSVEGLEGEEHNSNRSRYISYDGEPIIEFLDLGVHTINFTFPGSKIAYYHIDPMSATHIYLREEDGLQLGHMENAALSRRYNCTEFNSPLNDMQIQLTVYPDATLTINGSTILTRAYPPFHDEPLMNSTLSFSTNGDTTTGSANGTIILPRHSSDQFPFNSTSMSFISEYYDSVLNAQLDLTVMMPSSANNTYPLNSSDFSLSTTYSDGMFDAHLWGETELPSLYTSQLPFNVTDVTVLADYKNKGISGNITFHAVSGFPLSDVVVFFKGNNTEISFTGSINVIYGNYFGTEINATTLEGMLAQLNSTLPGQGEHSVYNMTGGLIECTDLNTTKMPTGEPETGARIDYNATLSGNFTQLLTQYLANMLSGSEPSEEALSALYAALDATLSSIDHASLVSNYYYGSKLSSLDLTLSCNVKSLWNKALQIVPPTLPAELRSQYEAWLKIANVTAYAVKSASISTGYSNADQRLDLHASLIANITQLKNQIIPILPDAVSPEFRDLIESCTNTTHCTLKSLNTTCNYLKGVTDFNAEWLLKGDLKTELNRIKHCYIRYLNLTSPYAIDWQIRILNASEIDISNFKAEIRQGRDWLILGFEGLSMYHTTDEVDPIRFRLYSLLNMSTDPSESPREFEKLKIILTSGSNATHTILLHAPRDVSNPDMTSLDYKTMMWENITMSSIKDMIFKIAYQGIIPYLERTYYVPIFTNSSVSNFGFDPDIKQISFNVTGTVGMGFCNITIPRALLYAEPEWTVKIDGVPLTSEEFSVAENAEYVFIYLNYSHSSHLIEIEGTWIVTEFNPNITTLLLIALSLLVAIFILTQRKKLVELKTKYQHTIKTLMQKHNQPEI